MPFAGPLQRGQDFQQRDFAGAVGTQQGKTFTWCQGQVHVVQDLVMPVGLAEMLTGNRRHGHSAHGPGKKTSRISVESHLSA